MVALIIGSLTVYCEQTHHFQWKTTYKRECQSQQAKVSSNILKTLKIKHKMIWYILECKWPDYIIVRQILAYDDDYDVDYDDDVTFKVCKVNGDDCVQKILVVAHTCIAWSY